MKGVNTSTSENALEHQILEITHNQIVEYDSAKQRTPPNKDSVEYIYPKCENGHGITSDDLAIIFGEKNILNLKKQRKAEAESPAQAYPETDV